MSDNTVSSFGSRCEEVYTVIKKTVHDPYGQYYISELALSILDLLHALGKTIPSSIRNLYNVLSIYTNFTTSITVISKVAGLITPDSKGRRFWQRPPTKMMYQILYAVNDAINGVYLLNTVNLVPLGTLLRPLDYISTTLKIAIYSLETINYGLSIKKCMRKEKRTEEKMRVWQQRSTLDKQAWEELAREKIGKWKAKESEGTPYEQKHAKEVEKRWVALEKDSAETAVKKKMEKWQTVNINCQNKIKKCWAAIAGDVLYIALLVFATIAEILLLPVTVPIAYATVAINALFVGYIIFEKCLDKRKVHH